MTKNTSKLVSHSSLFRHLRLKGQNVVKILLVPSSVQGMLNVLLPAL